MYHNLLGSPIFYVAPWDSALATRLDNLRRGKLRIAWLYESPDTSTFRYRCFNPARTISAARPDMGAAWFELADLPALMRELPTLKTLVICRVRYDAGIARLVARAKVAGVRVIFDCDDLVFDLQHVHLLLDTLDQETASGKAWDTWFAMIGRLEATARLCEAGIATNTFLARRLASVLGDKPVGIMPNYFEQEQQALSARLLDAKRACGFQGDGMVTIGYFSGSPTHNKDFAVAAPALARLLAADPCVQLRVVGFLPAEGPLTQFRDRLEVIPLQDYLNLQRVIAEVEINIAPLQDNTFTNCKSELKFFEAAAVGTWTIATPTFAFQEAIRDGETGRLARAHEWDAALVEAVALVRDPARYAPMAEATAEAVNARYGWDRFSEEILQATVPDAANARFAADRTSSLLKGIPRNAVVLEVGASYAPLAAKRDGWQATVVDHDTAAALRRKYDGAAVDVTRIEDVDIVWQGGHLHEAVPPAAHGTYDALIISHVLEHLPDAIAFLKSADRLLTQDGVIVVAVPDKRFCFDFYRPLVTAGAMLQAHLEQRTRHLPGTVFDEVSLSVVRDGRTGWPPDYRGGEQKLFHPVGHAKAVFDAMLAPDAPYTDCHAWQFTPAAFELLFLDLRLACILNWEIDWIEATPDGEIFAHLRRTSGTGTIPDGIQRHRETLLREMHRESASGTS